MTAAPVIAGAVIAAGAYLKWALTPVLLSFRIGRMFERVQTVRRRAR